MYSFGQLPNPCRLGFLFFARSVCLVCLLPNYCYIDSLTLWPDYLHCVTAVGTWQYANIIPRRGGGGKGGS